MNIIAQLFFLISLIVEFNAAHLLLENKIGNALISHLIVSSLVTFTTQIYLSGAFRKIDWPFYLFVFLLVCFVPFGGILISLFIIISIHRLRTKFHEHAEILDSAINITQLKPVHFKYGAGGALRKLMHHEYNPLERTGALFAIGQEKFSDINKFMYELLVDDSDEIRLLAFKILEQQETIITEDIKKTLQILKNQDLESDLEKHAKYKKNLAMLYWELVYSNLVFQELEASILQKALSYTLSALDNLHEDAVLWTLLGKIYTRMHQYRKAEEAFAKAISFNVSPSQVLPYLAEIKYKERDYVATKECLNLKTLLDVPLVAPVKKFWDLT